MRRKPIPQNMEENQISPQYEEIAKRHMAQINDCCDDKTIIEPAISNEQIIDISKASLSNYFCVFTRLPNIIYYIQDFTLPSATNNVIRISRPWHSDAYQVAGHTTNYGELNIDFLMDENFKNYFNLLKWMRNNEWIRDFQPTVSTASLIILNNSKIPIIRVDFMDVFPTSLGEIMFQNQAADAITFYSTFVCYNYSVTYLDGSDYIHWW